MKHFTLILIIFTSLVSSNKKERSYEKEKLTSSTMYNQSDDQKAENIYQFTVTDLSGSEFNFSDLKGKKIMIVNTASKCGNTPQYEDLQNVYEKYKDENFVIVGFPANNFGKQEPGTNVEIAEFCKLNYGVTFPMMAKISVKGSDMNEVYQFLTQKDRNGYIDSEVTWNFQKYLINKNGQVVQVIEPKTLPTDDIILAWIEGK